MTTARRAPLSSEQLELLAEAVASPDGLVRAVTTRQRVPDDDGRRRADLLVELADRDLVQLDAITGDRNSPIGEHAMVYRITAKGRAAGVKPRRLQAAHRG